MCPAHSLDTLSWVPGALTLESDDAHSQSPPAHVSETALSRDPPIKHTAQAGTIYHTSQRKPRRGQTHASESTTQVQHALPAQNDAFLVLKLNESKQNTRLKCKRPPRSLEQLSHSSTLRKRQDVSTCSSGDDSFWVEIGQEQAVDESRLSETRFACRGMRTSRRCQHNTGHLGSSREAWQGAEHLTNRTPPNDCDCGPLCPVLATGQRHCQGGPPVCLQV